MKDEIKEILKEIESYENEEICLIILNQEQNKSLLDYITNLQQENYKLKKELKLAEENEEYWHNAFSDLEDEYAELKDRIDRAIGYLETGKTFDNREIGAVVNYLQECLIDILKGENDE